MQVKDFCFLEEAAELAEGVGLVVSVRQAKTKRAWANQLVHDYTQPLLRWFLEGRVSQDLFLGRRRWSVLLKDALECLGLEKCNLALGSLRRGGACHLYVVLSVPGKPRLEGYHRGPGAQTWNKLEHLGGRFCGLERYCKSRKSRSGGAGVGRGLPDKATTAVSTLSTTGAAAAKLLSGVREAASSLSQLTALAGKTLAELAQRPVVAGLTSVRPRPFASQVRAQNSPPDAQPNASSASSCWTTWGLCAADDGPGLDLRSSCSSPECLP